MCELPEVARALVILSDQGLVAYHVPAEDQAADAHRLHAHLASRLPAAMVPGAFVALAGFPRTLSGKLDEAALPPPVTRLEPVSAGRPVPSGEVELLVASVWSEVLGIADIGSDDDFFALGGHSLVALHVVSRLRKRLGVTVFSKDVYRLPVLADFARHIEELRGRSLGQEPAS
ncbi:phosphopantetheine-binding protein [Nonomuraea thailandensis]